MSNVNTTNETISNYVKSDVVQSKIQEMFKDPAKVSQFVTSVISLVSSNADLKIVDKQTLLTACLNAASMNLPVNQNLGLAYIIPYKDKAQLQIGYKGFIQLAQRSGVFKTIDAKPIYEGQLEEEESFGGIRFNWKGKKSDTIVGYAAYFKLLNGFEKILYMTNEELKKHGKRYSQTYKKYGTGLWEDNFEAMATKTVIKLLLSKYAPLSIEMQKAVELDQAVDDSEKVDYMDNRPPSLEENNRIKELDRLRKWIEDAVTKPKLEEAYQSVVATEDGDLMDLYEEKYNSFK